MAYMLAHTLTHKLLRTLLLCIWCIEVIIIKTTVITNIITKCTAKYDPYVLKPRATYLNEWEQQAHCKVRQPVYSAGDHEGSGAIGLFKQLPCQDEGNPTWRRNKNSDDFFKERNIQLFKVSLSMSSFFFFFLWHTLQHNTGSGGVSEVKACVNMIKVGRGCT